MGNTVNLPVTLDSDQGRKLIADLARYSEGILSEADVKKKHHFDDTTWNDLGDNDTLIEEVEAEKLRRIRSGAAKREKAQHLVVKAPAILDSIMTDPAQSARHRVDAIKTLDNFAANGSGDARASETIFVIKFDLTADGSGQVETLTKTLGPTKAPWPDDINTAPEKLLPAIAAKSKDGGSGEPV